MQQSARLRALDAAPAERPLHPSPGIILLVMRPNCILYFLLTFHSLPELKGKLRLRKGLNIHQEVVQTGQVESDVFK